LLPSDPPKPAANHPDPRQEMWEIYKTMRERGELGLKPLPEGDSQHRIAELTAENERLRAALAGKTLPIAGKTLPTAIDPTEVVPPGEWRGERNARPGPDDPPTTKRPATVIEAKANPPAAAPSRPPNWDSTPGAAAWRSWVAAGGAHYDRWANHNE
jgi:hypothetical protein